MTAPNEPIVTYLAVGHGLGDYDETTHGFLDFAGHRRAAFEWAIAASYGDTLGAEVIAWDQHGEELGRICYLHGEITERSPRFPINPRPLPIKQLIHGIWVCVETTAEMTVNGRVGAQMDVGKALKNTDAAEFRAGIGSKESTADWINEIARHVVGDDGVYVFQFDEMDYL